MRNEREKTMSMDYRIIDSFNEGIYETEVSTEELVQMIRNIENPKAKEMIYSLTKSLMRHT